MMVTTCSFLLLIPNVMVSMPPVPAVRRSTVAGKPGETTIRSLAAGVEPLSSDLAARPVPSLTQYPHGLAGESTYRLLGWGR